LRRERRSKPDECTDDVYRHFDRARSLRPQTVNLLIRHLKEKVWREAIRIAADLFVKALSGNAIEFGQVGIKKHLFAAYYLNTTRDGFQRRMLILIPHRMMTSGVKLSALL
jgi:hypothetical protein